MRKSKIDLNIIKSLLDKIPDDMNVISIDLTDNTYKLHVTVDYVIFSDEKYNESLNELMNLISQNENFNDFSE